MPPVLRRQPHGWQVSLRQGVHGLRLHRRPLSVFVLAERLRDALEPRRVDGVHELPRRADEAGKPCEKSKVQDGRLRDLPNLCERLSLKRARSTSHSSFAELQPWASSCSR
jgi:hypothetical protein